MHSGWNRATWSCVPLYNSAVYLLSHNGTAYEHHSAWISWLQGHAYLSKVWHDGAEERDSAHKSQLFHFSSGIPHQYARKQRLYYWYVQGRNIKKKLVNYWTARKTRDAWAKIIQNWSSSYVWRWWFWASHWSQEVGRYWSRYRHKPTIRRKRCLTEWSRYSINSGINCIIINQSWES